MRNSYIMHLEIIYTVTRKKGDTTHASNFIKPSVRITWKPEYAGPLTCFDGPLTL